MKRFILILSSLLIASLGFSGVISGFDFQKDAYQQIAKFIETNKKLFEEGRTDELNFVYVYKPGEEFDFNRSIPEYFLSPPTTDWLVDDYNKIPASIADKFRYDLNFFNTKPVIGVGPDGQPETADDTNLLYQHFVVIIDGPQHFFQGQFKTIQNKYDFAVSIKTDAIYDNSIYYETEYENKIAQFVSNFDLDNIYDPDAVKLVTFAFSNPKIVEVAGERTSLKTVKKVVVDVEVRQRIQDCDLYEEFKSIALVYGPKKPINGFKIVADFIYEEIEATHSIPQSLIGLYDCDQFLLTLESTYAQDYFEARCDQYPNNSPYNTFLKVSSQYLDFVKFSEEDTWTLPNGQTLMQFIDEILEAYVTEHGEQNSNGDEHYLNWLVNYFNTVETENNKEFLFVIEYYSYFFDVDQLAEDMVINTIEGMIDIMERKDQNYFQELFSEFFPWPRGIKVERTWSNFNQLLINLHSGVYPASIRQEAFTLLNANQSIIWNKVLLPIAPEGEIFGVPLVGVSSLDLGENLALFIMDYYGQFNPAALSVAQNDTDNIVPFMSKSTLYSPFYVMPGSPVGLLVNSYLAIDFEYSNGTFDFEHCHQDGLVGSNRYDCEENIFAYTKQTFPGASKGFFDMVYQVNVPGYQFLNNCSTCCNKENVVSFEPAFFTALKIKNKNFNRKVEQITAGVLIATLPFSAAAAGVGSLAEVLYFGGLVAQTNFAIVNTVGTEQSLELLQNFYGEQKGQDYYDNFILANQILSLGALAAAGYEIAQYATIVARANNLKAIEQSVGTSQILFQTDDLIVYGNATEKIVNDIKIAGGSQIDDLVFNAESGAYEIANVPAAQIMSQELAPIRSVMDGAKHNIISNQVASNALPAPGSAASAHYISNSLSQLSNTGRLVPYANDLKNGTTGFSDFFKNSILRSGFDGKVDAYSALFKDPVLRKNLDWLNKVYNAPGTSIINNSNPSGISVANNVVSYGSGFAASSFWNLTNKNYFYYSSGDFFIKVDYQLGKFIFGNKANSTALGIYEGNVNSATILNTPLDELMISLKKYHGVSATTQNLGLTVSSGANITSTLNKTTTIIGRFGSPPDMQNIVNFFKNLKQSQFGPKNNGFNVLNVSDEVGAPGGVWDLFWQNFNRPWLEAAITRVDEIFAASNPLDKANVIFGSSGQFADANALKAYMQTIADNSVQFNALTGYGKEVWLLLEHSNWNFVAATQKFVP